LPRRAKRALPQIADHIDKFWDPRMRREIGQHLARGGAGLDPLAHAALATLSAKSASHHPASDQ
jgi:formate dehydrogenase subunit delta